MISLTVVVYYGHEMFIKMKWRCRSHNRRETKCSIEGV